MGGAILLKPEDQEVMKHAEVMVEQLGSLKISSQKEYEEAGEHLKSVKDAYKQIEEIRLSLTRPIDESKKRIMDLFRVPLERLSGLEYSLKRGLLSYQQEQERIRREQEAKLQAEAENKRQEALKKAEVARAKGQEKKAEKYEDKADLIPSPTLDSTVKKVSGVTTKKIWKFEVINEKLIPRKYLMVDISKIGSDVRSCGDSISIAGVRIYPEETICAGGR